jgi:hypothetical protein
MAKLPVERKAIETFMAARDAKLSLTEIIPEAHRATQQQVVMRDA